MFGLLLHTIYIWNVASVELSGDLALLSGWHDWCLVAAWIVAAAYLGLTIRRPQNANGVFILPLALALIGLGAANPSTSPFSKAEALSVWRVAHGVFLLMGTVSVTLGFAACLMYLIQSRRLKKKRPPRQGLKLPTLEWLQRFNRELLLISTFFLALGLLSGVILNLVEGKLNWNDLGILVSGFLFVWLVAATLFEFFYKPALESRKVTYLALASFVFLAAALFSVLMSNHAA